MTERRKDRMREVLHRRQSSLTVVMEDIHDPHNVSAVLRTADAVGIHTVQLLYTKEKFPKLGRKSSASAVKWIERRAFPSVEECYSALRAEGYAIYATQIGPHSRSVYDLDLTGKVALVFGNEHRGVSPDAAGLADAIFQIPMMGMIQSLNVSVACAVCLYEALRQRAAKGMYDRPGLPAETIEELFKHWMKK